MLYNDSISIRFTNTLHCATKDFYFMSTETFLYNGFQFIVDFYFGTSYFIVTLHELGNHSKSILVTQYNMESRVYDLFDRGSIFMASSSHLEGNNNSMQPCIGLKRVPCQTIKELSTIQSGF